MRSWSLFLLGLTLSTSCTGDKESAADDSSATDESDSDTDADTDTDADSDTDPGDASVSGTIRAYDGTTPAGLEIQVCDLVCFSIDTDATGAFSKTDLKAGSYKVDAIGPSLGGDYGHIRMHVDLEASEQFVLPAPMFVPQVVGPFQFDSSGYLSVEFSGGRYVSIQADVETFTVPFGYEEGDFWIGAIDGADIPPFWETPAPPVVALSFLPLATTVNAPFEINLDGVGDWGFQPGNYDVYSVDDHGSLEGPIGTGFSGGGSLSTTTIQPAFLTWLLFVPAQ